MADQTVSGVRWVARQVGSLERDVLVLSVAMLAFSLGFQMTNQYFGLYLDALGASALIVGAYRSFADLLGAIYPYAGGIISDRVGSRTALTGFGSPRQADSPSGRSPRRWRSGRSPPGVCCLSVSSPRSLGSRSV